MVVSFTHTCGTGLTLGVNPVGDDVVAECPICRIDAHIVVAVGVVTVDGAEIPTLVA